MPMDTREMGLSIADLSSRTFVWFLYVPQSIAAFLYKEHPIETTSRNLLSWAASLLIAVGLKHPSWGINSLFAQWMLPKNLKPHVPSFFNKLLYTLSNPLRPKYNYLQLIQKVDPSLTKTIGYSGSKKLADLNKAIIKKAFWSQPDFDFNISSKLALYQKQYQLMGQTQEAKQIKNFLFRKNLCRLFSVGTGGIITGLLIGVLLQKVIFRFFEPLDKKFFPEENAKHQKEITDPHYLQPRLPSLKGHVPHQVMPIAMPGAVMFPSIPNNQWRTQA